MSGRKQYWIIFLRTLAAFLAFWLVTAAALSVNHLAGMKEQARLMTLGNARTLAPYVQQLAGNGSGPSAQARKTATNILNSIRAYNGSYVAVFAGYDKNGNEVGRSPITKGTVDLPGEGGSYALRFDPVLTDREHIELAEYLLRDYMYYSSFAGEKNTRYTDVENEGLYGTVTGIIGEGGIIYPQRLVLSYENHEDVLVNSGNSMFDGAQLVTLEFDFLSLSSALVSWDTDPSASASDPGKLLSMYRRANSLIDQVTAQVSPGSNGECEEKNAWASYSSANGNLAYAYVIDPWGLATYGLGSTYLLTLCAAVLAAVLVTLLQVRSLKKERRLTRAVAHELKTPAAVLRAYAETLREDAVPEKRQEYLTAIVEESDRMGLLVNELLDLSRLEGSAGTLVKKPADLTALVREGFERLRVPMEERGLTLELDLEPVTVEGDPGRLEQMVNNLAVNALRHASPGPVRVFLKRENTRAVLTAENGCPPLPPEALKRLWEPFYKAGEDRSGEGGGLGLAVVRNIVTLHGGSCRAESVPGGIRFRVELP